MRYFLDTEFNDEVDPVQLISLGLVSEDGRKLYLENKDCDRALFSKWLKKNVEPHLKEGYLKTPKEMKEAILEFISGDGVNPEFWGYYSAYDWYLFCRLFGSFEKMPKKLPHLCMDVKQYAIHLGVSSIPIPAYQPAHNALVDAIWTRDVYLYLVKVKNKKEVK